MICRIFGHCHRLTSPFFVRWSAFSPSIITTSASTRDETFRLQLPHLRCAGGVFIAAAGAAPPRAQGQFYAHDIGYIISSVHVKIVDLRSHIQVLQHERGALRRLSRASRCSVRAKVNEAALHGFRLFFFHCINTELIDIALVVMQCLYLLSSLFMESNVAIRCTPILFKLCNVEFL